MKIESSGQTGHEPKLGGEGRDPQKALDTLWKSVLQLAAEVEAALAASVVVLRSGRLEFVSEVKSREELVDEQDVRIERECLRILALHAPVASNLRRVIAALRIGRELERMADLAEHIAKRAKKLTKLRAIPPLPAILEELAAASTAQVRDSVLALTAEDVPQARAVLVTEPGVDRLRRQATDEFRQAIREAPDQVNLWLHLINVARHLERVADHAGNLAENTIYLKDGEIIRHRWDGEPS